MEGERTYLRFDAGGFKNWRHYHGEILLKLFTQNLTHPGPG